MKEASKIVAMGQVNGSIPVTRTSKDSNPIARRWGSHHYHASHEKALPRGKAFSLCLSEFFAAWTTFAGGNASERSEKVEHRSAF